jgi:uncharacterized iron-regulated protein
LGTYENEQIARDASIYRNRKTLQVGAGNEQNKEFGGQINVENIPNYKEEKHTFDFLFWSPPNNGSNAGWGEIDQAKYSAKIIKGAPCYIKATYKHDSTV